MTTVQTIIVTVFCSLFSTISFSQENYDVLFDTDQYQLTINEHSKLEDVFIKKISKAVELKLIGHTDNVGSLEYNNQLSEKRVENIKQLLIGFGIDSQQIHTSYFGENKPLNSNSNSEDKKINRRVTILWELPITNQEDISSIDDLYQLLTLKKQSFCIDPNRDTILVLKQGTILTIPAHAFSTSSTQCVTFKTKEVYSKSDMIRENLSTTSNGHLLESGGMLYTEALDNNGNNINLSSGKSIGVLMPTDTVRDDMQLFYGKRDPHKNMNWIADNSGNGFTPRIRLEYDRCTALGNRSTSINDKYCKILFCRLPGRTIISLKGAFNKEIRTNNQNFRKRNRLLKNSSGSSSNNNMNVNICDSLKKLYGVNNWADLADTLAKLDFQKNIDQIKGGEEAKGVVQKLMYNVARINKLGWINCDAFSNIPADEKITMTTNLKSSNTTDCKIIFRRLNSVMPSYSTSNNYSFANIPTNESIWVLALKYENKRAYIYLEKTITKEESDLIQFKEISIDDLINELNQLNE